MTHYLMRTKQLFEADEYYISYKAGRLVVSATNEKRDALEAAFSDVDYFFNSLGGGSKCRVEHVYVGDRSRLEMVSQYGCFFKIEYKDCEVIEYERW
ncbi:hypothetical protein JW859_06065 [bacterium]|nr:hypothetical protein [bacterium]